MNENGKVVWVTKRIAAILNRRMKSASYPTTIATLRGRYGIAIIKAFAGSDLTRQKEIEIMIVSSYDAVHQNREGEGPPISYDYTSTARAERRRSNLNALAQSVGFETITKFLTAWLNGKIKVSVERVDA